MFKGLTLFDEKHRRSCGDHLRFPGSLSVDHISNLGNLLCDGDLAFLESKSSVRDLLTFSRRSTGDELDGLIGGDFNLLPPGQFDRLQESQKSGFRAEMVAGSNARTFESKTGAFREGRDKAVLPNACFGNPVAADVMVAGQKVAGAAQRRSRAGLLQQGSIQNVQLPCDFREKFAERLSENLVHREIEAGTIEQAMELAAAKYSSKAWLKRH